MDAVSEIRIYGIKPSRQLTRQLERLVEKWLRTERGKNYRGERWAYSIEIERLESSVFQCHVELRSECGEWRSQSSGKTMHAAVTQALNSLRPAVSARPSTSMWHPGFKPAFA